MILFMKRPEQANCTETLDFSIYQRLAEGGLGAKEYSFFAIMEMF
jgi:hypothetical protein